MGARKQDPLRAEMRPPKPGAVGYTAPWSEAECCATPEEAPGGNLQGTGPEGRSRPAAVSVLKGRPSADCNPAYSPGDLRSETSPGALQ